MSTLRDVSRALQRLLVARTRSAGLGLFEFLVLSRVATDGGATPGEVGRLLGLSTSTMTGVSDRLEAGGLVRRHPHPNDGRLLVLKPTAKGRRVYETSLGPMLSELGARVATLADDERAVVQRFLEEMIALLNRQADSLSRTSPRTGGRVAGPRRARKG